MGMHDIIENATVYDQLLAGPEVPVLTKNILLKKGAAYLRGMLITEGTAAGAAATQTAAGNVCDYIMKDDLDLTSAEADAVGTVYVSGRFNREKIVLAAGDTVEAHEAELRLRNIYFTALKS